VILADGFSCRTQIHELNSGGRKAMHLAELLASASQLPHEHPERQAAARPAPPTRTAKIATVGAMAVGAAAAAAIARTARR
jgi:hypothetical protein